MRLDLKTWRTKAGLTQKEVGKKLNVSEQTVVSWEAGETFMKAPQFLKFCAIVGADPKEVDLKQ